MNTIKKIALFFVLFLIQDVLLAQTSSFCDSTNWAKPGTYEIVIIPNSVESSSISKVSIPNSVLCEIETMRKDNKVVEYALNNCTLIRIYPRVHQLEPTLQK